VESQFFFTNRYHSGYYPSYRCGTVTGPLKPLGLKKFKFKLKMIFFKKNAKNSS
jgi:hypothetical protein